MQARFPVLRSSLTCQVCGKSSRRRLQLVSCRIHDVNAHNGAIAGTCQTLDTKNVWQVTWSRLPSAFRSLLVCAHL
jgi:hypothetical protein